VKFGSTKVGDVVAKGEAVADIETKKALVELAAPASGRLVEIVRGPGDEVPVLTPIAWPEVEERALAGSRERRRSSAAQKGGPSGLITSCRKGVSTQLVRGS
jgi:pyruvate/2-oxoglutarate dehydrogenase complex dihydrolipoamide acyltransferase (E2) component